MQSKKHWTIVVPEEIQEAVYDEQDRLRKERKDGKRPSIEDVVLSCIRQQLMNNQTKLFE